MPLALSLVMVLALAPWSPQVDAETETVTLLVEETGPGSALQRADGRPRGWRRVEVPVGSGVDQAIADLEAATGARVAVERFYELFAPEDEPEFEEQWHHHNTGQTGGTPDADVDSITAWGVALGAGVLVAVVDSGVDPTNPELTDRLHPAGWDFVDNDGDPSPVGTSDDEAHGTGVAGVIAAEVNGLGITGVAPETTILAIRSCVDNMCSNGDVYDGVVYAVDQGADIINLSLGAILDGHDPVMDEAMAYARSHDVLVVAAAGNQGLDLESLPDGQQLIPGGLPYSNILTVTSSNHADALSDFGNRGPSVVDIAAPGERILSTHLGATLAFWDGTSFSAPLVAGLAALLLSSDPGIAHEELIARITGFVDQPSGVAGGTASGRVNAGRSLTQRFIDTSSSVFVDAIDWLAGESITEGCNPPHNHQFCPGSPVTRGQMAVFLSRAFDLPATGTDHFDDDTGAFYEAAANRLAEAGLTVGCGAGQYCGGDNISRGEMAAMLARALSLPPTGSDHFDDDDGTTFENAINKIAEVGVTGGCNPPANNNYCPTTLVNRGQMAAFIKRSVELPLT